MACVGCELSMSEFIVFSQDADRLRRFLSDHHVIAHVWFCDVCHAECRVDNARQLFRCDRQETVTLYGGVRRSRKDIRSQKAW